MTCKLEARQLPNGKFFHRCIDCNNGWVNDQLNFTFDCKGTKLPTKEGRSPRYRLAHDARCVHLGDLIQRRVLDLYARKCKNPVISLHKCILKDTCVPYNMKVYAGYTFCKRCPEYDSGLVKPKYCQLEIVKRNLYRCTVCGKQVRHGTGNVQIRCGS